MGSYSKANMSTPPNPNKKKKGADVKQAPGGGQRRWSLGHLRLYRGIEAAPVLCPPQLSHGEGEWED